MFTQLLLLRKHHFLHWGSFCISVGYWWKSEVCAIDLTRSDIRAAICLHILLMRGMNQKMALTCGILLHTWNRNANIWWKLVTDHVNCCRAYNINHWNKRKSTNKVAINQLILCFAFLCLQCMTCSMPSINTLKKWKYILYSKNIYF